MTSSDRSYVGIAKQTAKGTANTTDTAFAFFMFNQGMASPNNMYLASDDGIGGGPLPNSFEKVGMSANGAFSFVVRPTIIGHFLMGALGKTSRTTDGTGYKHTFTMDTTDFFSVPYYTMRVAQGGMWGEQFTDMRVSAVSLNWRAADFIRGAVAMVGRDAKQNIDMSTWSPDAKVDRGATFIAPVTTITWPTDGPVKVLSGAITLANNIPLDEQFITGDYRAEDVDIVNRAFSMTLTMKFTSRTLYEKLAYDPLAGTQWAAGALKEGGVSIALMSVSTYDSAKPYKIVVTGNGSAAPNGNIAWQVTPLSLQSGRQVVASVTGTFLGVSSGNAITAELYNNVSATY